MLQDNKVNAMAADALAPWHQAINNNGTNNVQ